MDFELYPTITLRSRSFNALLAPREMFIQALNRNMNLQRFRVLYVSGNYSAILSRLDRRFEALETATEILAEIFGVRAADVEEMIGNSYGPEL